MAPTSIYDMLNTEDPAVLQFVPNYRINIISPYALGASEFSKFHTDLGRVLQYIKYSKDKRKLAEVVEDNEDFRNIKQESANLINLLTDSQLKFEVKGGEVDMCTAIKEMRSESEQRGFEKGIEKGIEQGIEKGIEEGTIKTLTGLVKDGILSIKAAAERAGLSESAFQQKMTMM